MGHLLPAAASPHTWPPYFGSPRGFLERGLAGWWGTFWHQTMRWSVAGPGIALAEWLGLERKGFVRKAVVLTSAFGLSGCVHMGLVPPADGEILLCCAQPVAELILDL